MRVAQAIEKITDPIKLKYFCRISIAPFDTIVHETVDIV
jgi:hypothetical protein